MSETKPRIEFIREGTAPTLRVEAWSECRQQTIHVATIFDADHPTSPCIQLVTPLGVRTVRHILDAFEKRRK